MLTFRSVASILSREREKSRPVIPESVSDLIHFLEDYETLHYIFKGMAIAEDEKRSLVFSSTELLEELASAVEIFVGCKQLVRKGYKIVPKIVLNMVQ